MSCPKEIDVKSIWLKLNLLMVVACFATAATAQSVAGKVDTHGPLNGGPAVSGSVGNSGARQQLALEGSQGGGPGPGTNTLGEPSVREAAGLSGHASAQGALPTQRQKGKDLHGTVTLIK